ncbi:hypothetical protein BKA67DRAFT_659272 [Truncatella angustata]|uniref:Uncharacterized protein n=1 Tax=Truncatella angustata TaxID=152316 RepID=A0A9P8UIC9_9PEZI|nr:uncharacterized protein BKA67DRAFT_659272 [Truncatella angustata]KAH6652573.1 hypothetical protein BKA67DRAFT_659272 [Truncatella angustata]
MCGPQTPRPSQSLGGALAVLASPPSSSSPAQLPFSGHLIFHTIPGRSSCGSRATHATFTSSSDDASLEGCMIGIHAAGDLRMVGCPEEETMLHRFDFRRARPSLSRSCSAEVLLDEPLEIGVGGRGIIGRKVSVWRDRGGGEGVRVAEGIVGFN